MRSLRFNARYQPFIEEALARALREVQLDVDLRASNAQVDAALGTRRRRHSLIDDAMLDLKASGDGLILLGAGHLEGVSTSAATGA